MAVTLNANTSTGFIATSDTSGVLQLQTGGTAAVTVDASQNVGIGTASPTSKLTVSGDIQVLSTNYLNFTNTAQQTYLRAPASNTLAFGTNSTEAMRIDSSGNVGIGTSSPQRTLHVENSSGNLVRLNNSSSANGSYSSIELTSTGGNNCQIRGVQDSSTAGHLEFYTLSASAVSERMRIDSSGNLLVGTTSTVDAGVVSVAYSAATSIGLGIKQTNSGAGTLVNFYNSAGTSQGYIYNNNNGTVSYANGSDYRLKSDIAALSGGLAQVMQLKPCTYKYIGHEQTVSGFIAHELAEVCPQAVVGEKDAVDAEGNPVYQGVDTSFLVATLTAAIQEQQAIITSLTDRITALEGTTP